MKYEQRKNGLTIVQAYFVYMRTKHRVDVHELYVICNVECGMERGHSSRAINVQYVTLLHTCSLIRNDLEIHVKYKAQMKEVRKTKGCIYVFESSKQNFRINSQE